MNALELIGSVNQILFVGLFVVVLRHALRQPTRTALNTALLFGSIAGVVALGRVADWTGIATGPGVAEATIVLLAMAPFAMLRLVEDFSGTPRWVQVAGFLALVTVSVVAVAAYRSMPQLAEVALVAFFAPVGGYAAIAFANASRRSRGITRRRMTAVAVGAGLFIAAVVMLLGGLLIDAGGMVLPMAAQLLALGAVVAFFLGFAPPAWIRRAWREPDLRGFLERSVHLAGVPDEHAALTDIQGAAAAAFGATGASIGIWDGARRLLRYASATGTWLEYPDDAFIAGRAFSEGRRLVALDAAEADPERAAAYAAAGARTVIAAPITTEDRRIGVLSVYADRAPIFVDDDLWLLELLAAQTAVLLEARTLTAHASELRAREDAARLKEEFLSSAAHDLRTPLTVVLGQAELLGRRLARDPNVRVDPASVDRIVREARRLRDLVTELLDVQRLEQGRIVGELVPLELTDVINTIRERHLAAGLALGVEEVDEPIVVAMDRPRIEQLIENLIENGVKYGGAGGAPAIRLASAGGEATVSIVDHGVGIPEEERARVFERFYRASNAHGVTDTGMGLGLYICRRIVEEHGGSIRHEPTDGGGSTFIVTLPLVNVPQPAAVEPTPTSWSPAFETDAADA